MSRFKKRLTANTTSFENSNYSGLDLFKFVFSFFIVAIHKPPLTSYSKLLNYGTTHLLFRVAVPFFFIVSGFFCFRKKDFDDYEFKSVLPYLKRLISLYCIWSLLYLPVALYKKVMAGTPLINMTLYIIRDFFIGGLHGHLWYLVSLIYVVAIVAFLISKKVPLKKILILSFFFFLIGHVNNYFRFNALLSIESPLYGFNHLIITIIKTPRNSIFFGFFYFSLGVCISRGLVKCTSFRKSIIGFVLSLGFLFIEIFFRKMVLNLDYDNEQSFFLIPASYFVFCLGSQIELADLASMKRLRKYSTLIYCSHMLFGYVLSSIAIITGFSVNNSLVRYVIICLCSLFFSIVVVQLSEKKQFSFLRRMY